MVRGKPNPKLIEADQREAERKHAESIAEMDLKQYCESGWADRIGLEKVSQSKKDNFTGINPCRKWPCEFGRTCKFLHIPTGKKLKPNKLDPKTYNKLCSGVGESRKAPSPISGTKERGPGAEKGGRRSQEQREERQKLEERRERVRKQAKTKIAETLRGMRSFSRENTAEEEGQQVRERLGRGLPQGGKEGLRERGVQAREKVRKNGSENL